MRRHNHWCELALDSLGPEGAEPSKFGVMSPIFGLDVSGSGARQAVALR